MLNAQENIFIFKRPAIKVYVKSMHQRQLLSLAASMFDPLGIITPFSIRVRCILQPTVKQGNNWSNQIPREFKHEGVDEYERMPEISIIRCLIANPDAKHELRVFTDTSSTAKAATIYIRSSSTEEITIQYVVSKARVAQIKAMGTKLATFARSEMTVHFDKIHFRTDSSTTLGWIKSTEHQKVFVTNRIAKILADSMSEQWNFLPGKINPADHGTRGLF